SVNPHLKVIFTVSPIRHKRDGFHANQVSKGVLLQAVDALVQTSSIQACYFPAYEIMMDELRDYRFYAADMIHPSEVAVEYIWQRFQDTYFDNKTKDAVAKAAKEWRRQQHRTIVR
ncbi:MAG: GSCFA domain-containing protein, partial [Prevotella sp.]|nr:GSCFA domain-containing protein [Prevotella sp.]